MIINSIANINTSPRLVFIQNTCGLLKLSSYWAIITPHLKTDLSHLTMGTYQNYVHQEIQVIPTETGTDLRWCTVYNDHVKSPGNRCNYKPDSYLIPTASNEPQVHELIQNLIALHHGDLSLDPKEHRF